MANTIQGVHLEAVSEQMLDLLSDNFFAFSLVSRNFSTEVRERGDRTVTRVPSSVTVKDLSTGYSASDVTSTPIEIALSSFKGFSMSFSDLEISKLKSPTILERTFLRPAIDATAKGVSDDLLGLITPSNFSASQVRTANAFDSDDLADAASTLTTNGCPSSLRTVMLNPNYTASLSKDGLLMDAGAYGSARPLQEGELSTIYGFGVSEYQDIPTANNLQGFFCHPSALCIAARQVSRPLYGNVEVIDNIEPRTGLPFQTRKFYRPTEGKWYLTVSILYGCSVGNQNALIRITDQ
tara:strand:+ start:1498 stop:2382 length:885 start_codon:yes stop_codon:yes gene_type:complete